jgi:hypothetical protein
MSTAQQVLVSYGVIVVLLGLGLGTILGFLRMKRPPIRTLTTAHVETLMQSSVVLGLAFAIGLVGFDSTWATWGAGLFAGGAAMQAAGVTLNWITDSTDQFADRSPGFYLNSLSTWPLLAGAIIIAGGVLANI